MQIPVLIEPVAGNGFRARGGEPLPVVVEAPTREEALAKVEAALQARLSAGAEIVPLEVRATTHPWMAFAGMFGDDSAIDDWVQSMAEYRQQVEDDPNR